MSRRRNTATLALVALAALTAAALAAHSQDATTAAVPEPAAPLAAMRLGTWIPEGAVPPPPGDSVDRVLARRTLVRRGSGRRREIALTFDDGPGPYTPAVVRALLRMHAPATFFPVASMFRRWPGALDAVRRGGFAVGDHTVDHPPLPALSFRHQVLQVRGQAAALRRRGFPAPRLLRPPYGAYDRRTLTIARRQRMLVVMWSVDSRDYTRPGARAIARTVLSGARPGAIVLMHDGGGPRAQTVAALPRIVRTLRRRGYRLVTVPALLARRLESRREEG
ncbi:MAG: peptidoglycan-N-acetylglucosamine deacetylase [Solirubrobacteraceae bacterium]|jgi:peptidoglycan/xylan/chitin deacetylase (PgdA/CDA1 family)|nr:peptidoglycan-N-acetylglucosamine deacetylase [Solirubrobacteraceae bacterium]